jgi:hypothetical protein
MATTDQLNAITPMVREQMRRPLRGNERLQLLANQLSSGVITKEQFEVRMAQFHASMEDE